MNKNWKDFFIDNIVYIGFAISSILSIYSYYLSSISINNLEKSINNQESYRVVLKTNSLISKSFTLAALGVTTADPSILKTSLEVYDGGINFAEANLQYLSKETIDYIKELKNIKMELEAFSSKMTKGEEQSLGVFTKIAQKFENLSTLSFEHEQAIWGEYLGHSSNYLYANTKSHDILKYFSFTLTAFLMILILSSKMRKILADKLQKQEELDRILFASLAEGVILCDEFGKILSYNNSAKSILGLTNLEIKNITIQNIFGRITSETNEDLSFENSPVGEALRSPEAHLNQVIGYNKNENTKSWLSLSSQPLYLSPDRKHFSTIFSFADITDRVEANLTIQKQQASLIFQAKMSALGQMAGGVAHEINNPLAIIYNEADDLKGLAEDDHRVNEDDAKGIAENILKTAKRIVKIVKGLKTFARDGAQDEMKPESLKEIVDDAVGICEAKVKSLGIKLEIEGDFNLKINCRGTQILQIFINFINNSRDAIEPLEDKWIKIKLEKGDKQIKLYFRDSGPGIPEAIRAKIFQPFFTTKEVGKGTGLGLSITKGIIEDHHGNLYIDSDTPNTCFVVTLPYEAEEKVEPPPLNFAA